MDAGTGAWVVGPIEVDPMTDESRAIVSLAAESGTDWMGTPFTLTIGCTSGSTEFTVSWWRWELGPERIIEMDTRIGDGEVTTDQWLNNGTDVGYGGADTAYIESLFGETRVAYQIQLPDESLASAVFDITGIENAVANVRETCGW
jgi:hypothetical protein